MKPAAHGAALGAHGARSLGLSFDKYKANGGQIIQVAVGQIPG